MSLPLFDQLAKPDVIWICTECGTPNYSGILLNSPNVDSSGTNYYAAFADTLNSGKGRNNSEDSTTLPTAASFSTPSPSHWRQNSKTGSDRSDLPDAAPTSTSSVHPQDVLSFTTLVGSPFATSSIGLTKAQKRQAERQLQGSHCKLLIN